MAPDTATTPRKGRGYRCSVLRNILPSVQRTIFGVNGAAPLASCFPCNGKHGLLLEKKSTEMFCYTTSHPALTAGQHVL